MKVREMSDVEIKAYDWLVNETKRALNLYRWAYIFISIFFLLVIWGLMTWMRWIYPAVPFFTSLVIGGQMLAVFGALILGLVAVSSPRTIALLSMTRQRDNPKLFVELMRSRIFARVGIVFIMVGFMIQLAGTTLPFRI